MNFKKPSFTLIELMIVVGIVGILSGIVMAVINPVNLQQKARDANRKKDLAVIASALEQYYADNNVYPISYSGSGIPDLEYALVTRAPGYLTTLPHDPVSDFSYCYYSTLVDSDSQSFYLCSALESELNQLNGVPPDKLCMSVPAGATGIYCHPSPF